MDNAPLREGLARYLNPEQIACLRQAKIGIAGAGGLGSNVALFLARSGVERFVLIDHDVVETSNLNRQHFWPAHLGQKKVEALKTILLELNPYINVDSHDIYLNSANVRSHLEGCKVWVEALDGVQAKAMFVEEALLAGHRVVSASGICGIGGKPITRKDLGRLTLVGDFQTDLCMAPPMAPRVSQAAAIMADCVLESILSLGACV